MGDFAGIFLVVVALAIGSLAILVIRRRKRASDLKKHLDELIALRKQYLSEISMIISKRASNSEQLDQLRLY